MCCLCNDICKGLDVQVLSDKDYKPAGLVSCVFSVTWLAGDVKEPTHSAKREGHGVPGVVVRPWFSVLYFMVGASIRAVYPVRAFLPCIDLSRKCLKLSKVLCFEMAQFSLDHAINC